MPLHVRISAKNGNSGKHVCMPNPYQFVNISFCIVQFRIHSQNVFYLTNRRKNSMIIGLDTTRLLSLKS